MKEFRLTPSSPGGALCGCTYIGRSELSMHDRDAIDDLRLSVQDMLGLEFQDEVPKLIVARLERP